MSKKEVREALDAALDEALEELDDDSDHEDTVNTPEVASTNPPPPPPDSVAATNSFETKLAAVASPVQSKDPSISSKPLVNTAPFMGPPRPPPQPKKATPPTDPDKLFMDMYVCFAGFIVSPKEISHLIF